MFKVLLLLSSFVLLSSCQHSDDYITREECVYVEEDKLDPEMGIVKDYKFHWSMKSKRK